MRQGCFLLVVMSATGKDQNALVLNKMNQSTLTINAPTPKSCKISSQRLRLSHAAKGIANHFSDELIDTL